MNIFVKNIRRKKNEFQFFLHQSVESLISEGFPGVAEFDKWDRFMIKSILAKFRYLIPIRPITRSKSIIICSSGSAITKDSWPYNYYCDIIPILWDCWPATWKQLHSFFTTIKPKICFITASQVVATFQKKYPSIKFYWIPESVNIRNYDSGPLLRDRTIEIFELGRQHPIYHDFLIQSQKKQNIKNYLHSVFKNNGKAVDLALSDEKSLLSTLPNIKIVVSFPKTDTHPDKAQGIETLTQRYWESMLSRNIIIGRAPHELINLIGYDPVINIDWSEPQMQLTHILRNITSYQELVNRNYDTAIAYADCNKRALFIKDTILNNIKATI